MPFAEAGESAFRSGRAHIAALNKKLAGSTLEQILEAYATSDDSVRASLRELFAGNAAFRWSTGVAPPPGTAEGFRLNLLYNQAVNAGVDTGPILREVAELSAMRAVPP